MKRKSIVVALLLLLQNVYCNQAVEVNEFDAAAIDEKTDILRCCRDGEDLEKPVVPNEIRCVPTSDPFKPLIYSPESESYVDVPTSWRLHEAALPTCSETHELKFVPHNKYNPYILFETGFLLLEISNNEVLEPTQFCVGTNTLMACQLKTNESVKAASTMRPKIRKCCGEDAVYENSSCVAIKTEPGSTLQDDIPLLLGVNNENFNTSYNMDVVSDFPTCTNITIIGEIKHFKIQSNASLVYENNLVPAEEYCIERIRENGHLSAEVFACFEHAGKGPEKVPTSDIRFTLYPVGFVISAIFLAGTLVTGCFLPASHHALHWQCQTYHVACLMVGCASMAAIQLAGNSLPPVSCKVLAILAHFFFLATFFWLNTMCFNIWWTFRDLRPASLEKGQEQVRLRFYSAYAWGGPLIVAGLAAIFDNLPVSPDETFLRPHFGEKQCWFSGHKEILAYFYGPVGFLLAVNLLFFAATARELTCGLWKGEFVKSTTERAALGKVCLKLVVVMGVTWIFDVISWMAGGPAFVWYVTDLCNAAQGVLIFIVVGCQPQVRATIKRFCLRNPRSGGNRQGNGLSTTSHGMPSMGDSMTQNQSTKSVPLETIC